jgi:pantoate--beta-alanine ligase
MGALHAGHLSLVRRSLEECDRTVATIFVNPTQFGPGEDFAKYPRTQQQDLSGLSELGVDLVFAPSQSDLYPEGFSTFLQPPAAAEPLEGIFRPIHFRGVVTVVLKLFHILPATIAYFGQKDYQQLTVIRRMVHDLNVPILVQGCPTVRQADGLAMSSRNRYLTAQQRPSALCLWKALESAKRMFEQGHREVSAIEAEMQRILKQEGADRIDYARIVDAEYLTDLQRIDRTAVALVAVHVGQTRLIDNCLLEV